MDDELFGQCIRATIFYIAPIPQEVSLQIPETLYDAGEVDIAAYAQCPKESHAEEHWGSVAQRSHRTSSRWYRGPAGLAA
jgi:hypothetical protein